MRVTGFSRALASMTVALCLSLSMPAMALGKDASPQMEGAQAWFSINEDGQVLSSYKADDRLPMASITKVMTAMVALDANIPMDEPCQVTKVDLGSEAQAAGFTKDQTLTFRQLMEVMLVYSANDAAVLIARKVGGTEEQFVKMMNEKAKRMGLTNTHFANPHGLEADGHYSSAKDLTFMGRYALTKYPFIANTVDKSKVTIPVDGVDRTFFSTDELLGDFPGMKGIKTGSVAAGHSFLGACHQKGETLYTCVLVCPTKPGRFEATKTLLKQGFALYRDQLEGKEGKAIGYKAYPFNFRLKVPVEIDSNSSELVFQKGGSVLPIQRVMKSGVFAQPGENLGFLSLKQAPGTTGYVPQARHDDFSQWAFVQYKRYRYVGTLNFSAGDPVMAPADFGPIETVLNDSLLG